MQGPEDELLLEPFSFRAIRATPAVLWDLQNYTLH